jgi:hypothetical protein
MGSVAQDQNGNITMGYSVSSETVYPSIRFTGRLASDALGQMTMAEQSIMPGADSQASSLNRWGEQSTMAIDPVDDCTFYYSNAYYETTSDSGWETRVASFRLDEDCSTPSSLTEGGGAVVVATDVPVPEVEVVASRPPQQNNNSLGHDQLQGVTSSGAAGSGSSSRTSMVIFMTSMMLIVPSLFKRTS